MSRLIVICALVGLSLPANAYNPMRTSSGKFLRWPLLPMKFNLTPRAATNATVAETQAAVRAAYKSWADVSCSNLTVSDKGVLSSNTRNGRDGTNTNVWLSGWPSNYGSSTLGITWTIFNPSSGDMIDADTEYNPNAPWATDGDRYSIDIQSVATHEIGHQLGLDHSVEKAATMFRSTGQGDTSQRSLHSDDIAGVCALYPAGGPPPPECTPTSNTCSPSEDCVNNKCVPSQTQKKGYGSPCDNGPSECESGLCLTSQSVTFCTQYCSSTACPNGDTCTTVQSNQGPLRICLVNSGMQATKKTGDPCRDDNECVSGICAATPTGSICAARCQNGGCSDPGLSCQSTTQGDLCLPKPEEIPQPPKGKIGDPCEENGDCQSAQCGLIASGKICTTLCSDSAPCPDGFDCVGVANSDKRACVPKAPAKPGSLGDACGDHSDCQSKLCPLDEATKERFCSQDCDPKSGCPGDFDCVSVSGGRSICWPASGDKKDPTTPASSGCALTSERGAPSLVLLILALALLVRRRRRDSRRCPRS
ncbi:MAG: matrixin family metalloprotease [Deltaproteobacteria bacterium]|nr:matrixin family metalloprotease [Deltaproteobacteria bacterium]